MQVFTEQDSAANNAQQTSHLQATCSWQHHRSQPVSPRFPVAACVGQQLTWCWLVVRTIARSCMPHVDLSASPCTSRTGVKVDSTSGIRCTSGDVLATAQAFISTRLTPDRFHTSIAAHSAEPCCTRDWSVPGRRARSEEG